MLLKIEVNERVMNTANIDTSNRLINGKIDTAKYIEINKVNIIFVTYRDGVDTGQIRLNGNYWIARNNKWVTSIFIHKYKINSLAIQRAQFPVMLSWGCPVHKVQSLTLTADVNSFDLENQKYFNQRQKYVALSRVTNLNKLHLIGSYDRNTRKVKKM